MYTGMRFVCRARRSAAGHLLIAGKQPSSDGAQDRVVYPSSLSRLHKSAVQLAHRDAGGGCRPSHSRPITFKSTEVAVPRSLFQKILGMLADP
jgi:hypothetical protein